MRIFRHTFVVLMALSQLFLELHSVLYWKAVIKEFVVELSQGPVLLVGRYLLGIEIVSLPDEMIGQHEDLSTFSDSTIAKVSLAFFNESVVHSSISSTIIILRGYWLDQWSASVF